MCARCQEIEKSRQDLERMFEHTPGVVALARDLERKMTELSDQLRIYARDAKKYHDHLSDLLLAHPRCAACGIMAGPDHLVRELVTEPHGSEQVCPTCAAWLRASGGAAKDAPRELVAPEERLGVGA